MMVCAVGVIVIIKSYYLPDSKIPEVLFHGCSAAESLYLEREPYTLGGWQGRQPSHHPLCSLQATPQLAPHK